MDGLREMPGILSPISGEGRRFLHRRLQAEHYQHLNTTHAGRIAIRRTAGHYGAYAR